MFRHPFFGEGHDLPSDQASFRQARPGRGDDGVRATFRPGAALTAPNPCVFLVTRLKKCPTFAVGTARLLATFWPARYFIVKHRSAFFRKVSG